MPSSLVERIGVSRRQRGRSADPGLAAQRPTVLTARSGRLVLMLLIVVGGAGFLYLMRGVGIANDEWTWLLWRIHPTGAVVWPQTHQSFLFAATLPYNGQPIVGEVLLYRLWADLIGVGHHWVLRLAYVAVHAAVVALTYGLVRRRLGTGPALVVAGLVLVSGRAWETVLFPASLTFVLPALAGLVAWRAIDMRAGRIGQALVAALLAVAALSGAATLVVLAGLLVEFVLRREPGRLWIVLAGLAPFAVWYVHEHSFLQTPPAAGPGHAALWAAKFLAAAAGATVGFGPVLGAALLVAAIAVITAARRRSGLSWPRTPRFAGLLVALLALAVLTAVDRADTPTPPSSSRYMYLPAILLLLLVCEALIGLRWWPSRRLVPAGLAVLALATILGIPELRSGRDVFLANAQANAARMGAMRVTGLPPKEGGRGQLTYTPAMLQAFVSRYGSAPIDNQRELLTATPAARIAVDQMLVAAELTVRTYTGPTPRVCRRIAMGPLPRRPLSLYVSSGQPGQLALLRYADEGAGQPIPVSPTGSIWHVRADQLSQPWKLVPASTPSDVKVCQLG